MPFTRPVAGVPVTVEDFGQPVYDLIKPTAWVRPTLLNSWTDKTTTGFVAYRRVGDIVYLRGYVGGGAVSTAIYALPAGFRPPYSVSVASVSYSVSGLWGSAKLDINTDGNIVMSSLSQSSTREYVNLECQFSVTA